MKIKYVLISFGTLLALAGFLYFKESIPSESIVIQQSPTNAPIQTIGTLIHRSSSTPVRAALATAKNVFPFPYAVTWVEPWSYVYNNVDWEDASTTFSLTGASAASGTLTLFFKINNSVIKQQGASGQCIPLSMRKVANELGDLMPPAERSWTADEGNCLVNSQTYLNRTLTFPLDPGEADMTFTSGGTANTFFLVHVAPDGSVTATLPPTND